MVNPYSDAAISDDNFIRLFEENIAEEELIWHRDKKDREILVIEGEDWWLQFDNQLPIELKKSERYFIKAEQYHRLIKGKGNLILNIKEKSGE